MLKTISITNKNITKKNKVLVSLTTEIIKNINRVIIDIIMYFALNCLLLLLISDKLFIKSPLNDL